MSSGSGTLGPLGLAVGAAGEAGPFAVAGATGATGIFCGGVGVLDDGGTGPFFGGATWAFRLATTKVTNRSARPIRQHDPGKRMKHAPLVRIPPLAAAAIVRLCYWLS